MSCPDGLNSYLAEISKIPLLSPAEEMRLAKKMRKGDDEARKTLVISNLRLVVSVAKKYLYYGLPLLDLIEEGNLGLLKAVDRYDPARKCKFSTYATWWIKQAITRSLSNYGRTIRIPVYVTDSISKYKRAAQLIYEREGKEPSVEEVAEEIGIKYEEALKLHEYALGVPSLESLMHVEEDGEVIGADVAEEARADEDVVSRILRSQRLSHLLEQLTPRESSILRHRYGLDDGEAHTLEETGKQFNLTRERIRQIENEVINKLKIYVAEHAEEFEGV
jgi:RNA polymerase primary sigma factor